MTKFDAAQRDEGFGIERALPKNKTVDRRILAISAIGNIMMGSAVGGFGISFGALLLSHGDTAGVPFTAAGIITCASLAFVGATLFRVRSCIAQDQTLPHRVKALTNSTRSVFWVTGASGALSVLPFAVLGLVTRDWVLVYMSVGAAIALTGTLSSIDTSHKRLVRLAGSL